MINFKPTANLMPDDRCSVNSNDLFEFMRKNSIENKRMLYRKSEAGSNVSRSLGMSVPRAKRFGMYRKLEFTI